MTSRRTIRSAAATGMALLAVSTGLLAWHSAPALSGPDERPEPVDFEVRAPAPGGALASSAARPRTVTIRPGKRFNVIGMRWRGARATSLRMRVRDARRGWRSWVSVPADRDHAPDEGSAEHARGGWNLSDPVWAGEAEAVQYRLAARGPAHSPTLHFVNTSGTATRLDRLRTRPRAVAGAAAAGDPPAIVSRAGWGAQGCPPRAAPVFGRVQLAFVHHTVTANEYGPQDSAAMVLGICRYHRNSNGWNDIGYNFLVDRYGTIFEGRGGGIDQAVLGAQAQGYNAESTGVASLGTFTAAGQSPAGLGALAGLLAWKLGIHEVPPAGSVGIVSGGGSLNRYPSGTTVRLQRISGHRDGDATTCPGAALYAQLPQLRLMVAALPRPAVATMSLAASNTRVTYPEKAAISGKLTGPDGSPLGGRPVLIQMVSKSGRWTTLQTVTTNASGAYATRVRLSYSRTVRAYFPSEQGSATTRSSPVAIGVRPRLTLTLADGGPAQPAAGDRVSVRGAVAPRKRAVLLLADRRSRGTFRRVLRRVVRTRQGRVSTGFRFGRNGVYRLRLAVLGDAQNLGARSSAVEVNVAPKPVR